MCGRFAILRQLEEIARMFEAGLIHSNVVSPNFNVAPTNRVASIVGNDERTVADFQWGFVPRWARPEKKLPNPINARGETVATNGMFRSAFAHQRCLIPADGFYEWQRNGSQKQPYFIQRSDGQMMAFAGIWERWNDPSVDITTPLESCAIITADANEPMSEIHNRMPVILESKDWDTWLDPAYDDVDDLQALIKPAEDRVIAFHPVSPDVGNVRNNRPDLIEPFEQKKLL